MGSAARLRVDRTAAARAIEAFLIAIGRDPHADPELRETGSRVADAFLDELCAGYTEDFSAMVSSAIVSAGANTRTKVVLVRDIAITTTCPHHLMPAIGTADIAFAPTRNLIGVGTVAKVAQVSARRLVLQESLGEDIAEAIHRGLGARWTLCRLDLAHGCMITRGERSHGARVETLAIRGELTPTEALAILAPHRKNGP